LHILQIYIVKKINPQLDVKSFKMQNNFDFFDIFIEYLRIFSSDVLVHETLPILVQREWYLRRENIQKNDDRIGNTLGKFF